MADLGHGTRADRVGPERADHKTSGAFPILLRPAHAVVAEDQPQDVALLGSQRTVIGEHERGCLVPRHDVPGRGLDDRRAGGHPVEQAPKPRRHAPRGLVTHLRRTPERRARLRHGPAIRLALGRNAIGARYHGTDETAIPFRAIAETIGETFGLPVASVSADEAGAHFGWLAAFVSKDMSASNTLTRERLGWNPDGPTLQTDIRAMTARR
jgi:hypothetical protein